MLNREWILKVALAICLALTFTAASVFAKSIASELEDYTEIQSLLAKDTFTGVTEAAKNSNFEVVYCPMKKARWVQKNGPIANPYYGSEMLECGVKEK